MEFTAALVEDYENAVVDRKVDASSPDKIVHDVAAFANTHGGFVIVGIADDGTIVGVEDFQRAEAAIVQSVRSRTDPSLAPSIFAFTHKATSKELLIVQVGYFEGAEPLRVKLKGKDDWVVFERIGSVSQRVDELRVDQMRRERRGTDTIDQTGSGLGVAEL